MSLGGHCSRDFHAPCLCLEVGLYFWINEDETQILVQAWEGAWLVQRDFAHGAEGTGGRSEGKESVRESSSQNSLERSGVLVSQRREGSNLPQSCCPPSAALPSAFSYVAQLLIGLPLSHPLLTSHSSPPGWAAWFY